MRLSQRYLWLIALVCTGCRTAALTVTEVVSVDTVVLSDGTTIRYAGLEGPPQESPWFEVCREANAYLVLNKKVELVVESGPSQGIGTHAYVYTPVVVDKKEKYLFVNAELAKFGLARVLPVPGSCQHKEHWQGLWNLQDQVAKPLKLGMWESDVPRGKEKKGP